MKRTGSCTHTSNQVHLLPTSGGVNCYVAEPKGKPNGKAIVIAPDIFGAQFINTQLLADKAAEVRYNMQEARKP
jgi:hypothetical protein